MKFGLQDYTLDHFFKKVVESYASRPALALIGDEPCTYQEFGRQVDALRATLRDYGVMRHDKVALLGHSSPHWGIAWLAVTTMGAVAVPILEDFPEADIDHIIRQTESTTVFIEKTLFDNLKLTSLNQLNQVICLDDFSVLSEHGQTRQMIRKQLIGIHDTVLKTFDKLTQSGKNTAIQEDDLAEILYTSGTTGHSKGVMLTHKNIVSNIFEGPDLLKVIHQNSTLLSILPMAHAFGCTSAFLSIIYCGSCIYFLNKPPSPKVLLAAMQQVRPTIMGAVPLVFEKIFNKQVVPVIAKNPAMRLMLKTTFTKKLLYRMIANKVKKLLGGRLECVIIGGAGFSPEVEYFMKEGGIPYCCGYGLSECAPLVTFSSMKEQKMGSPGHAIDNVQIRISEPDQATGIGEIFIKGPNVMKGYFKNDEETKRAFTQDGWLITGDRGYLDKDGFLFITGRSKNVIIGPSGENIYPEIIEAKLMESLYIEEALVYEHKGQLVARVYPDYDVIGNLERQKDEPSIARNVQRVLEMVRQEVNSNLPSFSKIGRIIEEPSPFMKTPTNKIKRFEYTQQ
jgi:long-chain acyl-CoA synthetase